MNLDPVCRQRIVDQRADACLAIEADIGIVLQNIAKGIAR